MDFEKIEKKTEIRNKANVFVMNLADYQLTENLKQAHFFMGKYANGDYAKVYEYAVVSEAIAERLLVLSWS